jgi:hypothetical protein
MIVRLPENAAPLKARRKQVASSSPQTIMSNFTVGNGQN